MIIATPSSIEQPLFSGPLQAISPADSANLFHEALPDVSASITIGTPQSWNISEDMLDEAGLSSWPHLLRDTYFDAVRFACSFESGASERIFDATFFVELSNDIETTNGCPIVYDLHPQREVEVRRSHVILELSPTLKFHEVEASLGKASLEFQYNEIVPQIIALGALTDKFHWRMTPGSDGALYGIRWFHAIIKSPRSAGHTVARLRVEATVKTPRMIVLTRAPRTMLQEITALIGHH